MEGTLTQAADDLHTQLGVHLSPQGFNPAGPRDWMRSNKAPIREVVNIVAMKGGCYSPRWGIALDFVPFVQGDRITKKSGQKLARLDLVFDPVDYEMPSSNAPWDVTSLLGPLRMKADASRVGRAAAEAALLFFEKVRAMSDVVVQYEEKKNRPYKRFGFWNYSHEPMAYAFALAAAGRADAGEALAEWLDKHEDRVDDRLIVRLKGRLAKMQATNNIQAIGVYSWPHDESDIAKLAKSFSAEAPAREHFENLVVIELLISAPSELDVGALCQVPPSERDGNEQAPYDEQWWSADGSKLLGPECPEEDGPARLVFFLHFFEPGLPLFDAEGRRLALPPKTDLPSRLSTKLTYDAP